MPRARSRTRVGSHTCARLRFGPVRADSHARAAECEGSSWTIIHQVRGARATPDRLGRRDRAGRPPHSRLCAPSLHRHTRTHAHARVYTHTHVCTRPRARTHSEQGPDTAFAEAFVAPEIRTQVGASFPSLRQRLDYFATEFDVPLAREEVSARGSARLLSGRTEWLAVRRSAPAVGSAPLPRLCVQQCPQLGSERAVGTQGELRLLPTATADNDGNNKNKSVRPPPPPPFPPLPLPLPPPCPPFASPPNAPRPSFAIAVPKRLCRGSSGFVGSRVCLFARRSEQ